MYDPPQPYTKMPVTTRSRGRALARSKEYTLLSSHTSFGKASSDSARFRPGFWPCGRCTCRAASFEKEIDGCLTCGHTMDDHEPDINHPWNPGCDYICPREALIASLLKHVRTYGVVVIRATPMVGKSVLLKLLGHHIVYDQPDLEPVFLNWQTKEKRGGLLYPDYLEGEAGAWRRQNERVRPHNPSARRIYLIDEAQDSYEQDDFWYMLKNHHGTRHNPLYVLVCVYGTDVIPTHHSANVESQARQMHCLQRIELRRTAQGMPCMLFTPMELSVVFRKFVESNDYTFETGVEQYLYDLTQGHPGMIGTLLYHTYRRLEMEQSKHLSLRFLQSLLVRGDNSFVEWLCEYGRGIWCPRFEHFIKPKLEEDQYKHLSILGIMKALCEVAKQPDGLTRTQEKFDEFAFCHKMGLLHAEKLAHQRGETTFIFASPLHRKVAYRRLLGPEPEAIWPGFSLQQICMNAISRFSPEAFRSRQVITKKGDWKIPERAFQNELFLCLAQELLHLPILTEYPTIEGGRMDFFILDRRWGIEILQCGNNTTINEHIARFAPNGRYYSLGMNDYIVLNFCPKSALPNIEVENAESGSHLFHIVVDPNESSAEFYTHDSKLLDSWFLGEGRKRLHKETEYDIPIKEPIPTRRELLMKMDAMRFRLECTQEEAQARQLATEKQVQLLKQELEQEKAKGAGKTKQAGSKSRKRKR